MCVRLSGIGAEAVVQRTRMGRWEENCVESHNAGVYAGEFVAKRALLLIIRERRSLSYRSEAHHEVVVSVVERKDALLAVILAYRVASD